MTFEERMAELGVDLSDLPSAYTLDAKRARGVSDIACRWFIDEDTPDGVALRNLVSIPLFQYILHLVDVIDRMETRIVNLTGELNYIKDTFRDCATCTDGHILHSDKCEECDENYSNYEFAGVSENWRPDDGCSD